MRNGGITYNGVEDEIRCPNCGYFFTAIRPALQNGQTILVHCKKCNQKEILQKQDPSK